MAEAAGSDESTSRPLGRDVLREISGSSAPFVALLDYGSGNLRSAERALERVGARVEVTSDPATALAADGLVVPGVGSFAACMSGLRSVHGDRIIDDRLAGGRPVLGICCGMQILFAEGAEFADGEHESAITEGCGQWPGRVERLAADVLPHMGWNTIEAPEDSRLFDGVSPQDRVYFVHSFSVHEWTMDPSPILAAPQLTWAIHGRSRFLAAVENGPLSATQFHPEKSGDVGARVLRNWVNSLPTTVR